MALLFSLIQTMSVFLVVAYLYSKSPGFKPLTIESLRVRDKIYLYFFFSAISMMGAYLGLPIQDALANTRAIGPVLAGIIGGPVLGTAKMSISTTRRWCSLRLFSPRRSRWASSSRFPGPLRTPWRW